MKKALLKVLILCMAVCSALCVFTACGESPISFKLNFIVDNEIVKTIDTTGNEKIALPNDPQKDGYTFGGWFWDKDVWEKPFTANSLLDAPLSSDMSVYAKFTKNHEHNYTATVTAPTCTEKGYTTYTCECGDSYKSDYVDKLEHEFTEYVYDNNATYEKDGTKTATCNHGCGATNTVNADNTKLIAVETLVLNKDEMYMLAGETDNIIATILPNNANSQEIIWDSNNDQVASVRNGKITAVGKGTATITACSVNNIIAVCQIYVCPNSFTYKVSEGEATITGFTDTTATTLVIPNKINSFPVKTIGSNAFKDRTMLTQIIIREGIETIQENGFYNCNSLIKIKLPDSLLEIGKNCFYSCKTIENITIPEQVKLIGSYAFMNCVSLKNVYFNAINCEATGTTLLLNPPYGPLTKQYRIFSDIPDNQVTIIVGKNVTAINHYIFNEDSTSTPLQFKEFIFMDPFNWFYEDITTWEKYPVENANEYFMGKHQIYGLLKGEKI